MLDDRRMIKGSGSGPIPLTNGSGSGRVGKNPGFLKNPAQWVFLFFFGFFGFFGFFWVFFGFLGFFCPDEKVFRVFFSFTNTFKCIQTLNCNHS